MAVNPHTLTPSPHGGNLPRHIPRRFISCVHIGSAIYCASIRYANRAKKIVTKALEVRIEKPPPTMHEALRDIRELKARHYTLHLRMMTCVYVHDSLGCICTPGITLVATSAGVAAAGARS